MDQEPSAHTVTPTLSKPLSDMCDRWPRWCALRDAHKGQCKTVEDFEREVKRGMKRIEREINDLVQK